MGGRVPQDAQVSLQSVTSVGPSDVSTKTPMEGPTGDDPVVEPSTVVVVSGGNVVQGEVKTLTLRRQPVGVHIAPSGLVPRYGSSTTAGSVDAFVSCTSNPFLRPTFHSEFRSVDPVYREYDVSQ